MGLVVLIVVLLAIPIALAEGGKHGPGNENHNRNVAVGVGVGSGRADAESTSIAEGGDATALAKGGDANAAGGAGGRGGNSNVNITDRHPGTVRLRNNAAIATVPGDTSLDAWCWVGQSVGGGSGWGTIGGAFARRDRECLAYRQFILLGALGLYLEAATAYCDKKAVLWKPFGKAETCTSKMEVKARERFETAEAVLVVPEEPAETEPEVLQELPPALYETVAQAEEESRQLRERVAALETELAKRDQSEGKMQTEQQLVEAELAAQDRYVKERVDKAKQRRLKLLEDLEGEK